MKNRLHLSALAVLLALSLPLHAQEDAPPADAPPAAPLETRLIPFGDASASEVRSMIEPLLSPRGRIVILPGEAKVLVVDEAGVIETAEVLLKEISAPRPNVRIEVSFDGAGSTTDRGVDVQVRVGGRDVQVGNSPGPRNSGSVGFRDSTTQRSSRTMQFLVARSGSSASLSVVQRVPVPETIYRFARDRGYFAADFRYESIGSQLSIRPTVVGRNIRVEVVPQITALVQGNPLIIDLQELATSVTVVDGGSLQIGGFSSASEEFNRSFFGGGSSERSSAATNITLKASILP